MFTSILSISLQQDTAYRANFIMWRVRSIIQLFLIFSLWSAVFREGQELFGYSQQEIMSYIFAAYIVRSLVSSYKTQEIAGEISRGDLTNYLLKPFSYFKYWFIRDLSSKSINFVFAIFEFLVIYFLLKPQLSIPSDFLQVFYFLGLIAISSILVFLLFSVFSLFSFWFPEQAWGSIFLLQIFIDFLGGAIYPLDIFPQSISKFFYLTPFPYIYFVPIQVFLNKGSSAFWFQSVIVGFVWLLILVGLVTFMWKKGLEGYRAEGR